MAAFVLRDGKWVDKDTGEPRDFPSRMHEIIESRQAPFMGGNISEGTKQFLSRIGGEGSTYSSLAEQGIIFDKPVTVVRKSPKIEMPEKFEERLVVPDEVSDAFRLMPGDFETAEDGDKYVVRRREKPAPVVDEEDDIDDDVEDPMKPVVTFDQLQERALEDAKRRRTERLASA